jgi:hypothetical protein
VAQSRKWMPAPRAAAVWAVLALAAPAVAQESPVPTADDGRPIRMYVGTRLVSQGDVKPAAPTYLTVPPRVVAVDPPPLELPPRIGRFMPPAWAEDAPVVRLQGSRRVGLLPYILGEAILYASNQQATMRTASDRVVPAIPAKIPDSIREPQPPATEVRIVHAAHEPAPAPDFTTVVLTQMAAFVGSALVVFVLLFPICVFVLRRSVPATAPVQVHMVGAPMSPPVVAEPVAAEPPPYVEPEPNFELGPTYEEELQMRQEAEARQELAVLEQLAAVNVAMRQELDAMVGTDTNDEVPLAEPVRSV